MSALLLPPAADYEAWVQQELEAAQLLLMLDTISPPALSGLRFDALAGYVGGMWPDFAALCLLYPALHKANRIVSVAVSAVQDAEFLDVERGDATIAQAPAWLDRQLARKVWRPGIYADLDSWVNGGLLRLLAHYGSSIRRWVADWDFHPGILAGYDAQQWAPIYLGRDIDPDSVLSTFFPAAPQPVHHNPPLYSRFPTGPFPSRWGKLDERALVELYDQQRMHPERHTSTLPRIQAELRFLADRDAYEAVFAHPLANGKPSWGVDYRGWRYQELHGRSTGAQYV